MPITDPLVLPVDVVIRAAAHLAPRVRARLGAGEGDYTVSRPRGRAHAKVLGPDGASLLEAFRSPARIVDVVAREAGARGLDTAALLRETFPLLRDCFNRRYLVPAGSPEAAAILPTLERGDRLGAFEILRCLQVLEDTELHQGRDERGTPVAIKLVRPTAGPAPAGMLGREAAVLAHLRGNGAPRLLARGRRGGRPWIALAWCEGVPPEVAFGELRAQGAPEDRRRLLHLARNVVAAWDALHTAGVLHGDVHPRNLLIDRRGTVTLLDFGLARPVARLRLGGRRGRGGVAWYLAPEHVGALRRGRPTPPPTAASEQYGVAALLYLLLTGHPWAEFSLDRETLLEQIATAEPLPFSRRGTTPWPDLEAVLARALRKKPGERWPSMRGLLSALRRVRIPPVTAPVHVGSDAPAFVAGWLEQVGPGSVALERGLPGTPTASVMFGGAGVAYALYRMACLRDAPDLLALADAWLCRTEARRHTPTAFAEPGGELDPAIVGPVSPFHAAPGLDLVRALTSLALGDGGGADAAVQRFVTDTRTSAGSWANPDLTLGRTGTVLAAAHLLETLPADQPSRAEVHRLGDETLLWLWSVLDRLGPVGRSDDVDNLGIAHGWAGMLYASLRWAAVSGTPPPAALPRRLEELADAAEALGRGVHWRQPRRTGNPDPWAEGDVPGWCNGPTGFIWLWTLAHERLGRRSFLALAEGSAWSAWEARGRQADLCCGLAGRALGLLRYYRYTGDIVWRNRALQLVRQGTRQVSQGAVTFRRPLSLFQGVTGIALLAAELDRPETASMPLFESEG